MPRVHTHYDNLKVTRDAPPEVIRAAYQALAKKYHPDRNQGDIASQRVMQLINAAHEALSDPVKRDAHDRWISSMEAGAGGGLGLGLGEVSAPSSARAALHPVETPANSEAVFSTPRRDRFGRLRYVLGAVGAIVAALLLFSGDVTDWLRGGSAASSAGTAQSAGGSAGLPATETVPGYIRPLRAPSGEAWPATSDYVPGFKKLFDGGVSTITLENTAASDLYVKLYALRDARAFAVRWVYLKSGESFAMREVRAGRYDVRYRDLESGAVARSDWFELEERTVAEGTRVTNIKMKLAKPPLRGPSAADLDF